MAAPQLNVDVLAIACEFLSDVSDILAFALTCSSLRPIATQCLLAMHPVLLTGGESVRRFHAFLFADPPARTPHVRALDIRLPVSTKPSHQAAEQSGDASLFLNILNSSSNLQHVCVTCDRHLSQGSDDLHVFRRGIAALQSLHSLSVYGLTIYALAPLRAIRSPLRILHLHCQKMQPGLWVPYQAVDPAALEWFLPNLVPTFQKLELKPFMVEPDLIQAQFGFNVPLPSVFSMTQYPSVRSLSVPSFFGKPLLGHLQHLFPALDGRLYLGRLDSIVGQDINEDGPSSSSAWKKLDAVVCHAQMFYVLGLRCPIRLVMLDHCAEHELRYITEALSENPVPRLKLTLGLRGLAVSDGLFPPELAERLTHLTLCLLYSNDYSARLPDGQDGKATGMLRRSRWDDVRAKMLTALRPLHKLTHLRVVAHASVHDYAYTVREPAFDFGNIAASLVRAQHPSLRYIFLTAGAYLATWYEDPFCEVGTWMTDERWYTTRGWRIAEAETNGSQGERTLVELHPDVAETIIRNEELILSEADEEALHMDRDY
ncbi:hypothetical protein LXA43DRAFT_1101865 [Ganoderma leucocontextum]|nr:hypothetical protein LXA43DRAFT_1101865 [Ganoderma leucocontextum]